MTGRLPDAFFKAMYAESYDPWRLADRWYEQRKYAITMAMLPPFVLDRLCAVGEVVFT